MTTVSEGRARRGIPADVFLACWTGWALFVLLQYFTQAWRALLYEHSTLRSIAWRAAHDVVGCAIVGAIACACAWAIAWAWGNARPWVWPQKRARTRPTQAVAAAAPAPSEARSHAPAHPHAPAPAHTLFAAGLFALPWFAVRDSIAASVARLRLPGFPAFGEALGRAIDGSVGAALVSLAALALGGIIARAIRLGPASRLERLIVSMTLGFGGISIISLVLAGAGVYRPSAVSILIAVSLIAGAMQAWFEEPTEGLSGVEERICFDRPRGAETAWLVLAVLAFSFAVVAALAPETEFDALWYHLYLPQRWLEAGRAVDLIQEFPSLYPLGWELVLGAAMVMGGVIAAKLLSVLCLALLAALVAVASRRWWAQSSPWVAIGLLMTVPTVLWEASTAYNDLALALFAAAGCYALARDAVSAGRSWLIVAGLEFGLAASTKHLGLVVLAIAVAICAALLWRHRRLTRRTIAAMAVIVIIAAAIPLPWYVRSSRASGNPFFPELYGVFGGGPAARWDDLANRGLSRFKAHFGRHDGALAIVRLPWDVTVHSALFGGALGPLWLILLPALLARGRAREPTTLLAAGSAAYVAFWASPISSYQMRFLVPITPALALLGSDAWLALSTATRRAGIRAAVQTAIVAIAWFSLPPFMPLHEVDRVGWTGMLTHVLRDAPLAVVTGRESADHYLSRVVRSYAAWRYANAHVPESAVILTFSAGDQLYSHRARIPHDSVLARPIIWTAHQAGDVEAAMKQLGVTHVLFDKRALPELQSQALPIASSAVQQACRTEYEDRYFRLCRMQFDAAADGVIR